MTPGRTGDSRFGVPGSPGSEQPLTVLPTQPPAEDKINGILLGFRLRYRELVYDSLRGFTLRGIGNPGATWAELTRECPRTLGGCVAGSGGGGGDPAVADGGWRRAASCAPRPLLGTNLELSGFGCAPRSCHRLPRATRSVVPNTLVCDVAGSVPLCSAPVSL